jgi:hypothetical protein
MARKVVLKLHPVLYMNLSNARSCASGFAGISMEVDEERRVGFWSLY